MYPGLHAVARANQPAIIMAQSGEAITYAELEARSNRLAHFLRSIGLKRLDHYAIFTENNVRHIECCAAGERAGLYYTCINSFLTPAEVVHIVNNSQSQALITSQANRETALAAGCDGYVSKPVDTRSLPSMVARYIHSGRSPEKTQ